MISRSHRREKKSDWSLSDLPQDLPGLFLPDALRIAFLELDHSTLIYSIHTGMAPSS